jgi:hypothetical protein
VQRIFRYAGAFEYTLQGIAIVAAIGSGAGIALQNLIFGEFITVITDYASGHSSNDVFLDDVAELAYALPGDVSAALIATKLTASIASTLFTLASPGSVCPTFTTVS